MENECISHNFILFAIFLPTIIIKIGGNLTKSDENKFAPFLRHGVVVAPLLLSQAARIISPTISGHVARN